MSIKLRLLLFYLNTFKKDDLTLSAAETRKIQTKELPLFKKICDYAPIELAEIKDEQISMRDGAKIKVRIYRPTTKDIVPLIIYFHGGGFVQRDIESHDLVCRRLAKGNQAVIVSVDYRLAPELSLIHI